MSPDTTDEGGAASEERPGVRSYRRSIQIGVGLSVVAIAFAVLVAPAAAQANNSTAAGQSVVCQMNNLTSLLQTGFTIFTYGALILGFFSWVATSAVEALPVPREWKKSVKKQRNSTAMSAGRAVFVPGIAVAALGAAGIGIPQCISPNNMIPIAVFVL